MQQWHIEQARTQAGRTLEDVFQNLSQVVNPDLPDSQRREAWEASLHGQETMRIILASALGSVRDTYPWLDETH